MSAVQRRRLLIVLCADEYVRNYLTTDAFDQLESDFECHYIGSQRITLRDHLERKRNFHGFYQFDEAAEQKHYELFSVLMWRYRRRSSSFRFRMMRQTSTPFGRHKGTRALLKATLAYLPRLAQSWKERVKLMSLGNSVVFPGYQKRALESLPANETIRRAVEHVKPDAVVFPSSAYDPAGNDVARICTAAGVPSLFLVDNWDNLSSKSIMWAKPDYVAVWGKQSAEHAVEIQELRPERVIPIGTPRFDQYFQLRTAELPSHFDHPYVLFVGTALAFNEAKALESINRAIAENPELFGRMKVVYRPHPWRQGSDSIIGMDLPHVVVDPQLAAWYAGDRPAHRIQPDLTYYPTLLRNAEFAVGGLTSMIIEAQIFWKRFLALVYNDKEHLTSQHNALKYYVHFKGLERLTTVDMCHFFDQLGAQFVETWKQRHEVDRRVTDEQRRYILFDSPEPYKKRLSSIAARIARD